MPLLGPLAQDLAEWRLRADRPPAATLVHDGGPWTLDPAGRINAADRIRKAREELRFRERQPTLFDAL